MSDSKKFMITGLWNGKPFEKIIEAEDENDAAGHFMFFASMAYAQIDNFEINKMLEGVRL
ncbi:hypothetical protein [Cedecea sp. P7760]|uniref:hypothetical protein n=1 Tax=Cedecea sp. P7760 TaxID=2726983 RepID=UPI0015A177EF|nr:hypothetical protein [Cedecea sp. P7760]NWC63719.1 hypothetical protein [Cedecea sp. P7760]